MNMRTILFLCTILVLSSCGSWTHHPFTNVERIINVKKGMTIADVNTTLGISPYDVYHIQDNGSAILIYNYRLRNRNMKITGYGKSAADAETSTEASQTAGENWYAKESYLLYVIFKDNKVETMMTEEGSVNSETVILMNNDIRLVNKEKISYYTDMIEMYHNAVKKKK